MTPTKLEFSLLDQRGKLHRLSDYLGKWVVVYFYPKDNTPGCTTEACGFRDIQDELQQAGIVVLGISADTVESHAKFAQDHNLNFPILSDPEKKVIAQYGAWQEKKMFGKTYFGIKRISFLINPQGEVAKEYQTVKVAGHAQQILKDVSYEMS